MAYPVSFLSTAFIGVTIFLQGCVIYWQGRRAGVSHEHALHESTVVSLFFVGTATIHYLAVISKYA
ncbi:MAG: hypothetical protein HYZ46_05830 [Nitrosomonadales bacterium]|nr:hypothetical protein [Nitrosomonadales bacterium]